MEDRSTQRSLVIYTSVFLGLAAFSLLTAALTLVLWRLSTCEPTLGLEMLPDAATENT